ncbi:LPXTG cell wall anchor domain-containing protein [Humibacter sp. RRB41]|uniref:LPXTG cell wall anchor domain-containing protein n=1 Tax=Humibacter sp. RRB41 TaxID=2919946 RepID=UPI001FAAFDE5|nr:LPXTG cell wall anchor domain-containing protein [Humibacter sp. RRB41]
MNQDLGGLAATGSNVTPWLIVAGIIVLLGVIALVIAGVVRSRRAERQVEDAAEVVADAGGTLPAPDANAPASDETVIQEAAEIGGAGAAAATGTAAAAAENPETEVAPFDPPTENDDPSK